MRGGSILQIPGLLQLIHDVSRIQARDLAGAVADKTTSGDAGLWLRIGAAGGGHLFRGGTRWLTHQKLNRGI